MGWYVAFSSLSQTQIAIIEDITRSLNNVNHFICGFAGSGKSVLLTHVMERMRADHPNAAFAFLSYTHALVGMAKTGLLGSGLSESMARGITFSTAHKFMFNNRKFDFVFVDEVQDLEPEWLRRVHGLSGHVVLAGDYEQSIYDGAAPRDEMNLVFSPKVHELREVFRLTPSLKKVAVSINPSAKNIIEADPVNSVDADIREVVFDNFSDEVNWVLSESFNRARVGRPSAILFHRHAEIGAFFREAARLRDVPLPKNHASTLQERYIDLNDAFVKAGVPLSYFGNQVGTLMHGEKEPHSFLMTMHSAKGLDFKNVILPSLCRVNIDDKNEPFVPRVCFVGVTRTFENLFLTRTGTTAEPPFDQLPGDVVTRITPGAMSQVDADIFF